MKRLQQAVHPGSMLHRKQAAYRLAAVTALAEAGTHTAIGILRSLVNDRDREVRSAVEKALKKHAQGSLAGR